MDFAEKALGEHEKLRGKIEICTKASLATPEELATFYTPGVAAASMAIHKDPLKSFDLTWRSNTIAIVSDGTAVLGLGDIGPEAALPVMEGKAAIFKEFGGVNAVPLCIATKNVDEIVRFVQQIEPCFGGINLEDISAPRCFEIERKLSEILDIPVFHDDQHGTAIVVLAALKNALKVVKKKIEDCKIVISGAGAAGIAVSRLLAAGGAKNIVLCDSQGAIHAKRKNINADKLDVCRFNLHQEEGALTEVLKGADVFIGVSAPNILKAEDIAQMNPRAIVFAMANPVPEIMPLEAKKGGAMVVATGRSDFENQVNNALVFPGIFRGILDARARQFTPKMFLAASDALAKMVAKPTSAHILPSIFDRAVGEVIAAAVRKCAE